MPAETESTRNGQPTIAPEGASVTRIPGTQLSISLGKEVVIRVPGVEQSLRGKVVGYDADAYVIVNMQLPVEARRQLALGGQAVLKYMHNGAVFGFRTSLQDVAKSPVPLAFFAYPESIEKIDVGRSPRKKIELSGVLSSGDGGQACTIVNLSETGCRISACDGAALKGIKIGDIRTVDMLLGDTVTLKASIAVRNMTRQKGTVDLGAMFLDFHEGTVTMIQQFLAENMNSSR